jgi:hypothetical protein
MDSFCPKCRRRFADSRGVLVHLNHKYSSCYGFLDDYDALSAFSEEDTQRRNLQHAQQRALLASQDRVPSPSPPPISTTPPPISTTPPPIKTTTPEYHPRSSFIYGRKANTFERTAGDSFAHRRANNPYYPFQGREEWGLARFLARSSLSQSEIDEFLKLEWVPPFQSLFLIWLIVYV